MIGGQNQGVLCLAGLDRRQGLHQCGCPGTLGRCNVDRADLLVECQGRSNDPAVEPILERHGRRAEVERVDMAPVVIRTQQVAGGLDGHCDRILVPVGHGSLALPLAEEIGRNPGIGLGYGFSLKPQARDIPAIGCKSHRLLGHPSPFPNARLSVVAGSLSMKAGPRQPFQRAATKGQAAATSLTRPGLHISRRRSRRRTSGLAAPCMPTGHRQCRRRHPP